MTDLEIARPDISQDLRWALCALELVANRLQHNGHRLTANPNTSSAELWNLRTAIDTVKRCQQAVK